MEVHPAADVFPMLSDAELDELASSIKKHGLLHPIVLFEGKILDGRNRQEACQRARVDPIYEPLHGVNPWDWVWSTNAERRHLKAQQKAAAFELCCRGSAGWAEEQARIKAEADKARAEAMKGKRNAAKKDAATNGSVQSGPKKHGGEAKSRAKKAKAAGVSTGTMQKAEAVKDDAVLREVASGKTSLNEAYRTAGPTPRKKSQRGTLYNENVHERTVMVHAEISQWLADRIDEFANNHRPRMNRNLAVATLLREAITPHLPEVLPLTPHPLEEAPR